MNSNINKLIKDSNKFKNKLFIVSLLKDNQSIPNL